MILHDRYVARCCVLELILASSNRLGTTWDIRTPCSDRVPEAPLRYSVLATVTLAAFSNPEVIIS